VGSRLLGSLGSEPLESQTATLVRRILGQWPLHQGPLRRETGGAVLSGLRETPHAQQATEEKHVKRCVERALRDTPHR
jgi:hypothetical protein